MSLSSGDNVVISTIPMKLDQVGYLITAPIWETSFSVSTSLRWVFLIPFSIKLFIFSYFYGYSKKHFLQSFKLSIPFFLEQRGVNFYPLPKQLPITLNRFYHHATMDRRLFLTFLLITLFAFCHLAFGEASKKATYCTGSACRLPDCFCAGARIPKGLPTSDVPQFVMMSFDGNINSENFKDYQKIFTTDRKNPNGCPIKGLSHLRWVCNRCLRAQLVLSVIFDFQTKYHLPSKLTTLFFFLTQPQIA